MALNHFSARLAETLLLQVDHESSCYLSLFSFKSFFVFFFIIYWLSMIKWRFRGGGRRKFFRSSTKWNFSYAAGMLSIRPVRSAVFRCQFWLCLGYSNLNSATV